MAGDCMRQTTDHVLMVRPVRFAFNEETAANNVFQQRLEDGVGEKAIAEFDAYVALLRENGITVDVLQDTPDPPTPDSIFPNNCFSTHRDDQGKRQLVVYPMFATNRRWERTKLLASIHEEEYDTTLLLTDLEAQGFFLEGTGSLVLDREHRVAYACRSPRTHHTALAQWAELLGYETVVFDSADEQGTPVYHTNVMMHVGTHFAVICLDSIHDTAQRSMLVESLTRNGKEIVDISLAQMHQFAGNMLELRNSTGEKLLVMSQTARQSLTPQQIAMLEQDVHILSPDIHTIETVGGGSARCMLAEIF